MRTLQEFYAAAKLKHPVVFAPYIELAREPYQSQVEGLNKLLVHDRYGLYDEPGSGKTMIAQAAGLYWISEGYRCVALMPPSLLYQFKDELFNTFIGADKYVACHVLDQTPVKRKKLYAEWKKERSWPEFMVMSYQMFAREYQQLMKAGYNVLILDEAQNVKSSQSAIFQKITEFVEQPSGSALVLMTGTPAHNELIDLYSMIKLTSPNTYSSLRHFEFNHCVYKKIPLRQPRRMKRGGWMRSIKIRVGYKNKEGIKKALYRRGRRVLKKDIFEIRDPTITEVPVRLESQHLALYKKLVKERLLKLQDKLIIATNPQALRQQMLQIVTCPELYVDGELPFKNMIVATVQDLLSTVDLTETKALVFANYQNSVRTLAKYFEEHNPALMYGQSDSEKNRKKFLEDDTCRLMIAHPKSAGVGLNLQHVCHTVIFAEPTGVPGDFKQAMDRVVRPGQRNLVNVYILKAMGTIAPKATEDMLRKEGEVQDIHHDWHTFLEDFKAA